MVQRPQQIFFLLITVMLLHYSAASWPGLWPLRPYLDLGATGAPTFNLGVYWGVTPLLRPLPENCSRWGCIMNDFAFFAKFGPTSSLGALYSGSPRPSSWTSLLVSTLMTMAGATLVWLLV